MGAKLANKRDAALTSSKCGRALGALALAVSLGLTGCAVEPEASIAPQPHWKTRKPVDEQARFLVIAAYRSACLDTSLDLGGAERALTALGFSAAAPEGALRRYERGSALAELTVSLGGAAPASTCAVTDPGLDRFAAIDAMDDAIRLAGVRYEPRDLAALGDPDAHDIRGTALGVDYIGIAEIVDSRAGAGLSILKRPRDF
ncbi:MAG: hypothetical protein AAF909_09735 [Pseudomonadota bacterium]